MPKLHVLERTNVYLGYHHFHDAGGIPYGSFEVFHNEADPAKFGTPEHKAFVAGYDPMGFYWWPCRPGCLPDGEAHGPFPTAEGAYLDAIGE